jgi:hypothetical protein
MHNSIRSTWRPAAVALAALILAVCGGKDSGSPSQPSVPIANPTSTPVVVPTPGPPLSASCAKLPPAAENYSCRTEHASFRSELDEVLDTVKSEHPEAFDGETVKNVGLYIVEVIKAFDQMGICADYDGEELGVTTSHDFNDQYDILTAKNEIRRYFVGSCYPSVVPVARRALGGIPGGCNLPPSREVSCGDPAPLFDGDVAGAIAQLLKTKPELFDFTDIAPRTDWPRVKDMAAYYQAIIDILVGKGYCALFDGEEIQVKKTNEFSEHYDVNYSDKYVRTGPGSFRGTCYPAAF